jgi:hypothetical protein
MSFLQKRRKIRHERAASTLDDTRSYQRVNSVKLTIAERVTRFVRAGCAQLVPRLARNDRAEIAQAARQRSFDQFRLRLVAPARDRPMQLLDLVDDLTQHTRTRPFVASSCIG